MPNYLSKLASEMTHHGTGYIPTHQEIQDAIDVGMGRAPHDVVYGEQGLQAPSVAGGMVSLDPTDYLGPAELKALLGVAGKGIPLAMAGMTVNKGDDMARLIREAQAQIDAENAARNIIRYQPEDNRVRNALIGIGAGGAGLAGGYYGTDYLSR